MGHMRRLKEKSKMKNFCNTRSNLDIAPFEDAFLP